MDIQPPHHTAGDFAALRDFNEICEGDIMDDNIEFGGVFDHPANLAGRIIGHDSVFDRFEMIRECFPYKTPHDAAIVAFDERINELGFRTAPFPQIAAEFNAAHNTNMTADDLEYVRRTISDKAVLGMGCKNLREFRHILIGAYCDILDGRSSRELTWKQVKHLDLIKKLESAGKLAIADLYALGKRLAELNKMPRQLTASKVKKILGCDDASAEILRLVYCSLPFSPIV